MSKLLKVAAGLVALSAMTFSVRANDAAQGAESTTTATQLKVYYDRSETNVQGDVVNLTLVALKADGSVAKDASDSGVVVRGAVNTVNGVIDANPASTVVNGVGSAVQGADVLPSGTAFVGVGGIYAKSATTTISGADVITLAVGQNAGALNTKYFYRNGFLYAISGTTFAGGGTAVLVAGGVTAINTLADELTYAGATKTSSTLTLDDTAGDDAMTLTAYDIPQVMANNGSGDNNLWKWVAGANMNASRGQLSLLSTSAIVNLIDGIGATCVYYPTSLGSSNVTDTVSVKLQKRTETSGGGNVIEQIGETVNLSVTVKPVAWNINGFRIVDLGGSKYYKVTSTTDPDKDSNDSTLTAGFGKGYFKIQPYATTGTASYVGPITATLKYTANTGYKGTDTTLTQDVTVTGNMLQTGTTTYEAILSLSDATLKAAGTWTMEVAATVDGTALKTAKTGTTTANTDANMQLTVLSRPHDSAAAPWKVTARLDRTRIAKYKFTGATANPAQPILFVEALDNYGNAIRQADLISISDSDDNDIDLKLKITGDSGSQIKTGSEYTKVIEISDTGEQKVVLDPNFAGISSATWDIALEDTKITNVTVGSVITNAASVQFKTLATVATVVNNRESFNAAATSKLDHTIGAGANEVVGYTYSSYYGSGGNPAKGNQLKVGYDYSVAGAGIEYSTALTTGGGSVTGWTPYAYATVSTIVPDNTQVPVAGTDFITVDIDMDGSGALDAAADYRVYLCFEAAATATNTIATDAPAGGATRVAAKVTCAGTDDTKAEKAACLKNAMAATVHTGAAVTGITWANAGLAYPLAKLLTIEVASNNDVVFRPKQGRIIAITVTDTTTTLDDDGNGATAVPAGGVLMTEDQAKKVNEVLSAASATVGYVDIPFANDKDVVMEIYDSSNKLKYTLGDDETLKTGAYNYDSTVDATFSNDATLNNLGALTNIVWQKISAAGDYAIIYDKTGDYAATKIMLDASAAESNEYYTANGSQVKIDVAQRVNTVNSAAATVAADNAVFTGGAKATVAGLLFYDKAGTKFVPANNESYTIAISSSLKAANDTKVTIKYIQATAGEVAYAGAVAIGTDAAEYDPTTTNGNAGKFNLYYDKTMFGKEDTLTITIAGLPFGETTTQTIKVTPTSGAKELKKIRVEGQTTCPVNGELLLKVWGEDAETGGKIIDTSVAGSITILNMTNGTTIYDARRGVATFGGNNDGRFFISNDVGMNGVRFLTFKAPSTTGTYTIVFSNTAETVKTSYPVTVEATTTAGATLATGSGTDTTPVVTVTAAGSATNVAVGGTLQLSATTSNLSATETYTWGSSDATKATVNATGLVTGVAAGSVIISATGATSGKTGQITLTVGAAATTGKLYCPFFLVDAGSKILVNVVNAGAADASVSLTSTAGATVAATTVAAGRSKQIDATSAFTAEVTGGFTLNYSTTGTAAIFADSQILFNGIAAFTVPCTSAMTTSSANAFWFNTDGFIGLGAIMNTGTASADFVINCGGVSQTKTVAAGKAALFTSAAPMGNVKITAPSGSSYVAGCWTLNGSLLNVPFEFGAGATEVKGGIAHAGDLILAGAVGSDAAIGGTVIDATGLKLAATTTTAAVPHTITASAGKIVVSQLYLGEAGAIIALPLSATATTKGAFFDSATVGSTGKVVLTNTTGAPVTASITLIGASASETQTVGSIAAGASQVVTLGGTTVKSGAWTVSGTGVTATGYTKAGSVISHAIGQ